MEHGNDLMRN